MKQFILEISATQTLLNPLSFNSRNTVSISVKHLHAISIRAIYICRLKCTLNKLSLK